VSRTRNLAEKLKDNEKFWRFLKKMYRFDHFKQHLKICIFIENYNNGREV
jgi:hypothetical protein